MTDEEKRAMALAAAHSAAEATAELMRYAREGAHFRSAFGDVEPIERLLDAAKMAIEIEAYPTSERSQADDDADPEPAADFGDLGQVYSAICNYLDGWVP